MREKLLLASYIRMYAEAPIDSYVGCMTAGVKLAISPAVSSYSRVNGFVIFTLVL